MKRLSYKELVGCWKKVRKGKLKKIGFSSGYPLYGWQFDGGPLAVYLSSGIHGDEPAGPMAITRLLEELPAWFVGFSWTVFPCLNPWGFEHQSRRNAKKIDLNRQWRKNREPEISAVRKVISKKCFDLAYLMHEDFDARGFYLYELAPSRPSFGKVILKSTNPVLPLEVRKKIEGRLVKSQGLICRDASYRFLRRKKWPEAFFLIHSNTDHLFTAETPSTGFDLQQRVNAHLRGLRAALAFLKKQCLPFSEFHGKKRALVR